MYKEIYPRLNQFSFKQIVHQNKSSIFMISLMIVLFPQVPAFAMSKGTHHSIPMISCPTEFDEVECDSFQDGVRNGQLDEMTAIPNPFLEEAQDSAIHAMPYIRGYELIRGRKRNKSGG
jgi:hypothetical protein